MVRELLTRRRPRARRQERLPGHAIGAGLPVPPGFAVSADCYRKALADGGLTGQLDALIAAVDPRDPGSVAAAGERARALIGSLAMSGDLADAIRAAYARLCEQGGDGDLPVAVRSSATCEDQPDASFAGEHDTYLWVRGGDSVVTHVLRCWASLFTDRGIAYRIERGYGRASAAMSVGVQQMVRPRAAGVAFTLNPTEWRPVADRHRRVLGLRRGRGQRRGHPGQLPGRQGHGRDHPAHDLGEDPGVPAG